MSGNAAHRGVWARVRLASAWPRVAGCALLCAPAAALAYAAMLRWQPSLGDSIAGYRTHVHPVAGTGNLGLDVGIPAVGADGAMSASIPNLDVRTDYIFSVTAYWADGIESPHSNELPLTYAQVAPVVDSDADGLNDAVEDANLNRLVDPGETDPLSADTDRDGVGDAADACQDTAAGQPVTAAGCACAQLVGEPWMQPAVEGIGRTRMGRLVLRPGERGAWRFSTSARLPWPLETSGQPPDFAVALHGPAGEVLLEAAVPGTELVVGTRTLTWTQADATCDGLCALEIRPAIRTTRVRMRGTVPAFVLPDATGSDTPAGDVVWSVRLGPGCVRAVSTRCLSAGDVPRCR